MEAKYSVYTKLNGAIWWRYPQTGQRLLIVCALYVTVVFVLLKKKKKKSAKNGLLIHIQFLILALLESSISRAQAQLTKTAEAAANLGLVISAPKTEYMTVNCNPQPALQVYGDSINHVSDLDTLVPWCHLAQVTSKGESHLLGVHSGSWNNFGRVHTYPLQQKSSCLILLVSLYYSLAVNRGWSPRIWKTKSTPLLPHATESCWI